MRPRLMSPMSCTAVMPWERSASHANASACFRFSGEGAGTVDAIRFIAASCKTGQKN